MPVSQIVLEGVPGGTSVIDASLVNVIPIEVCRDNKEFDIIIGSAPGNRQARYYQGAGMVEFLDTFAGDLATDVGRTSIFVKYKY